MVGYVEKLQRPREWMVDRWQNQEDEDFTFDSIHFISETETLGTRKLKLL